MIEVVGVGGLNNIFELGLAFGQGIKVGIGFSVGGIHLIQLGKRIFGFGDAVFNIAAHVFGWI